jgi:hypothetical protein
LTAATSQREQIRKNEIRNTSRLALADYGFDHPEDNPADGKGDNPNDQQAMLKNKFKPGIMKKIWKDYWHEFRESRQAKKKLVVLRLVNYRDAPLAAVNNAIGVSALLFHPGILGTKRF